MCKNISAAVRVESWLPTVPRTTADKHRKTKLWIEVFCHADCCITPCCSMYTIDEVLFYCLVYHDSRVQLAIGGLLPERNPRIKTQQNGGKQARNYLQHKTRKKQGTYCCTSTSTFTNDLWYVAYKQKTAREAVYHTAVQYVDIYEVYIQQHNYIFVILLFLITMEYILLWNKIKIRVGSIHFEVVLSFFRHFSVRAIFFHCYRGKGSLCAGPIDA